MSRIYEALQRAELERQTSLGSANAQARDQFASPPICDPLPAHEQIDIDRLPRTPWKPSMAELPAMADHGKSVEQFRSLRSHLHLQRLQQDVKTILVSSGLPAEGKTFIAVNLVMSLAQNSDQRVLLIDGDLRRPAAHKLLGASASPGLAEYLEARASLSEVIQRSISQKCSDIQQRNYPNISFISAGKCSDGALELICSHRLDELISQLAPLFDWIIIDSPPVLVVTDAVDLARTADAIILVARAGRTPYAAAQKAQRAFTASRLLGFVLNASKDATRSDPYYSYYYDADPDAPADRKRKRGHRK